MIIKSVWDSEKEKELSLKIKEFLKNREIKKFYYSDREIKNFKISFENNLFKINYSLKGLNLKYYVSLLNSSFLIENDFIKVLFDKDWLNYKEGLLK